MSEYIPLVGQVTRMVCAMYGKSDNATINNEKKRLRAKMALEHINRNPEDAGLPTPEQPAAPDEDAAGWRNTGTIEERIDELQDELMTALREYHESRRPVDTRPTMTVSELVDGLPVGMSRSLFHRYAKRLIGVTITPDPAPAAEVPVVEVRDTVTVDRKDIKTMLDSVDGKKIHEASARLRAALTKATDR